MNRRIKDDVELTFAMGPKEKPHHLKRSLKPRHLNMIAIGGSIGTGLFVASGGTIATAGPGGALLAYALIGLMVYFLMTSLGELAAYMPVSGSFCYLWQPLRRRWLRLRPGLELLVQLGGDHRR